MIGAVLRDASSLLSAARPSREPPARDLWARSRAVAMLVSNDAFVVLVLWRARESSIRLGLPMVNTLLRRIQTSVFGVEIDRRVHLGQGVWMVHPVGTVIGGDSQVGDRVRLMGSNTIGTNQDDGYPRIGHDVVVGVGARILGPVRVGDGARIGAGAIVLHDVPAGALAVGVPARIVKSTPQSESTGS